MKRNKTPDDGLSILRGIFVDLFLFRIDMEGVDPAWSPTTQKNPDFS